MVKMGQHLTGTGSKEYLNESMIKQNNIHLNYQEHNDLKKYIDLRIFIFLSFIIYLGMIKQFQVLICHLIFQL